eukprot:11161358-Lingulodinium_polyedra.AAC.2
MFGMYRFEAEDQGAFDSEGRVKGDANPWARVFVEDVDSRKEIGDSLRARFWTHEYAPVDFIECLPGGDGGTEGVEARDVVQDAGQRHEQGGEHGIGNDANRLVQENQSPISRTAFASLTAAGEQFTRSLVPGRCMVDNTTKQYEVIWGNGKFENVEPVAKRQKSEGSGRGGQQKKEGELAEHGPAVQSGGVRVGIGSAFSGKEKVKPT